MDEKIQDIQRRGGLPARKLARLGRLDEMSVEQLAEAKLVSEERLRLEKYLRNRLCLGSREPRVSQELRIHLNFAAEVMGMVPILRWAISIGERALVKHREIHPEMKNPGLVIEALQKWSRNPEESHLRLWPVCHGLPLGQRHADSDPFFMVISDVASAVLQYLGSEPTPLDLENPMTTVARAASEARRDDFAGYERRLQEDSLRRLVVDPRVEPSGR